MKGISGTGIAVVDTTSDPANIVIDVTTDVPDTTPELGGPKRQQFWYRWFA